MKSIVLVALCLCLAACQSGPQTTLYSSNDEGVRNFGPYFENDKFPVGGAVLVDAIITLGPERLPKDWKPQRALYYSDGEVEAVFEIYFTNLTDKPVELKLEGFQGGRVRGAISPAVMAIPPGKWMKSDPLVTLTSNYRIDPWEYSMSLVINGQSFPIKDKLVRMTIEQLKARHGKKDRK